MNIKIIVMLCCILLSGYFSATETAFSSFNRTRMRTLAEKGSKSAARVLSLADNYDKLISTVLIGNNIVNILLASLGTLVFVELLGDIGATVSTVVITLTVLVFGEISPKSIAKDCPEKFAVFSAPVIGALIIIFTPINLLFSLWKKLLSKLFNIKKTDKMSQDELLTLVDEVEQGGSIDNSEGDLLRNAIEFNELRAEDILTHRVDVAAVSEDASKEEVAAVFSKTKFSRLLVYSENMDSLVGVIHHKDFYDGNGFTKKPLKSIAAPPIYIHKYEKLRDILKELQQKKSHVAVVIDEYGGTLGIVTMEDILEELVGDIWDEHDEVVESFRKIDDSTYIVDCAVTVDDFNAFFDIEIESESISLNGWIMEQLGKIPEKDDNFAFENLEITVTEAASHRAEYARIVKREPKQTDENGEVSEKDNGEKTNEGGKE